MKKYTKIIFVCTLLLTVLCFGAKSADAKTNGYKVTKYKSYSAVRKAYLKKEWYRDFGMEYAYKTIKTKWGNKNAMILYQCGFTADIAETHIFVKHKKKIYQVAHFIGYANAISRDKKYMFVSGGGTCFAIYRYSGGRYKKYKYVFNDGQEEYKRQQDKLSKKYGVSNMNIKYTFYKK